MVQGSVNCLLIAATLSVKNEAEVSAVRLVTNSGAERLRLEFRQSCKLFLMKMVPLVRRHHPRVLLNNKELSVQKLTTTLRLLVETGRIEEKCCDSVLREFGHFFDHNLMSA